MFTQLLDAFSFISVILRGFALGAQTLIIGGAIFSFWILRPLIASQGSQADSVAQASRKLIRWSAVALAFIQLCYIAADAGLLLGTTGLSGRDVIGAGFFIAGTASILAALWVVAITARRQWTPDATLLAPSLAILGGLAATSHAAGRIEGRTALLVLGALHMLAVASWIGTLPYFVMGLARSQSTAMTERLCRWFSNLAAFSVVVLTAAGVMLALAYVDSPQALYGTAYGAMVGSKTILFGIILLLGGLNFLVIRRMATASGDLLIRLRRFAEAEIGIGFTVVLAAASLSSQPPAVDLNTDRIPLSQIVQRMSPQWPSFTTPPVSSLSPATPLGVDPNEGGSNRLQSFVPGTSSYQPNTANDIAWSEYNHHWSGIIVLIAGVLALAARVPAFRFARYWPLAFLGLAVFLFLRADPENWPLGPRSFWQSFAVAEVLQHRLFVVLIVMLAVFESGVATGQISSPRAALVFPALCAIGGALLLTHAHPLSNIKEELLSELSHIPIAIFAVIAGWSRWLELRVPGRPRQIVTWVWPVCFMLIGFVLLNYRES